jgi:hypothetical protein
MEVPMGRLARLYNTYGKAIWATAVAVFVVMHTSLSDGHVTKLEAVQIAAAVVTAVGVWWIPTHPQWAGAKTAVAFLVALLGAAVTVIENGAGSGSWPDIALGALTVVFVGAAPARSTLGPSPAPGSRLVG